MNILQKLAGIVKEPPPEFVFELSEAGLAYARLSDSERQAGFVPFLAEVVSVSPLKDNVLNPDILLERVRSVIPVNGEKRKTQRAILVLPDFCARIAVIDFDNFPAEPAEQVSLLKFRLKRSVPFDVESAAISYHVQKKGGAAQKIEVVVAAVSLEILARYEAPFRALGIHLGIVTTSSLAGMDLLRGDQTRESSVLVKLSGKALTVAVLEGARLKLLRCLELEHVVAEEMLSVLYPTVAYVEDELGARPSALLLCGFGELTEPLGAAWASEFNLSVDHLRSRFGAPGQYNSGVLGVLEGMEA